MAEVMRQGVAGGLAGLTKGQAALAADVAKMRAALTTLSGTSTRTLENLQARSVHPAGVGWGGPGDAFAQNLTAWGGSSPAPEAL